MLRTKLVHSTLYIALFGGLFLIAALAARPAQGMEMTLETQVSIPGIQTQQERLNLMSHSPLIARGQTLGEVVVFDDPATRRSADYLEVYDIAKRLVAIVWFDSFGIRRTVIDRALVEGGDRLTGVLVAILEGEPV